jgi:hypothetical protein
MVLYISMAGFNLYKLMYPLAMIDISPVPESDFVQPLWKKAGSMHMRVYLSTRSKFSMAFIRSEYAGAQSSGEGGENGVQTGSKLPSDVALLWDEDLSSPAFSKSFMLTTLDCDEKETCESDESFRYAASWLDEAEQLAVEQDEGGVLSVMSAAGQGIESTSFLLTAYQSVSKQTRSLLASVSLIPPLPKEAVKAKPGLLDLDRTMIKVPKTSPIWSTLGSNATLYVHVLVLRTEPQSGLKWPPTSMDEAMSSVDRASRTNSLLLGKVDMTKFDKPHHLTKPRRILVHDLVYLWKRYFKGTREFPPWEMAYWKPEDYAKHEQLLEMKKNGATYPYWKPEVSIKYVNDESKYPIDYAGLSGMPMVQVKRDSNHPTGIAFIPALHVDEIGLTSEKYIPVNETLTSLPLRISFDRSDMDHQSTSATATAGGISPARWRLLSHLSAAIEQQKKLGFEQSDIDDVRRLIADTNVTLLAITMFASAMHLLFEFLTFKSEVSFWQNNKDLTGLSVRSLFLDTIGQSIILLFLIEKDSSLLMTIPCAIGCLIALWKCQRAAGFRFVKVSSSTTNKDRPVAWWNRVPRLVGYELRAMRMEASERADSDDSPLSAKEKLYALTLESDQIATKTLGVVVLPLVVGYTLYSFAFEEHSSWFSWLITSASSAVYALGFVLMTPQLFLNYKLKSVAHLPWRVLVYKSLNTFIDDLFSFIIRMPTMARISCFRDDIVFFIYLYQRWMYPVDDSRPIEGGGEGKAPEETTEAKTDTIKKKNQ